MIEPSQNKIPVIVVALYSGSYTQGQEGHEKYNEVSFNGKYYGYCPPLDNINISKLGASKKSDRVEGVLVIYVSKIKDSTDRVIRSFALNATVFSKPQFDGPDERVVIQDGNPVKCSYSILSDNLVKISNYSSLPQYLISPRSLGRPYLLRSQRFYRPKNEDIVNKIVLYIRNVLNSIENSYSNVINEDQINTDFAHYPSPTGYIHLEPKYVSTSSGKQVNRNPKNVVLALGKADYLCEANPNHITFNKPNGRPYMEAHHLIPCTSANASKMWKYYKVNIDCVENMVCLCPTCHRKIHFGNEHEKESLLRLLYDKKKQLFHSSGINIDYEDLKRMYSFV